MTQLKTTIDQDIAVCKQIADEIFIRGTEASQHLHNAALRLEKLKDLANTNPFSMNSENENRDAEWFQSKLKSLL